ncbi:MAG: TIR domain-containing protein, partial [Nitrospira sp.]
PKVFISYSHDSLPHKQWVLKLAADLRTNGVDAVIDQWDLSPGEDIPMFMEQGLKSADRVVTVCSARYVERANNGKGGVGYEKMIVTAELIENLGTKKFVPIVRNGDTPPVPTFLGYRLYIDFEDDAKYPTSLEALIRELLDIPDPGKPPLGTSPFDKDGRGEVIVGAPPLPPSGVHEPVETVAVEEATPNYSSTIDKLKRLISEPSHALNLHELVTPIANNARGALEASDLVNYSDQPTKDELVRRVYSMNRATRVLEHVLAVGCHWASDEQSKTFVKAVSRVALVPNPEGRFFEAWTNVARYPALRALYASGVAAYSNEAFGVLHRLMIDTKSRVRANEPELPLLLVLHHGAAFAQSYWKWLPGMEKHYAPVSDYLEESLRPAFREITSDDEEIALNFDRFELFQALVYGDLSGRESAVGFWAPLGSFMWRRRELFENVRKEIEQEGAAWKPLQAGFFAGSKQRAIEMVTALAEFTGRVRGQLGIW